MKKRLLSLLLCLVLCIGLLPAAALAEEGNASVEETALLQGEETTQPPSEETAEKSTEAATETLSEESAEDTSEEETSAETTEETTGEDASDEAGEETKPEESTEEPTEETEEETSAETDEETMVTAVLDGASAVLTAAGLRSVLRGNSNGLDQDYTLTESISFSADQTIDLQGHTLTLQDNITIEVTGGTLTIRDGTASGNTKGSGKITRAATTTNQAPAVKVSGGTLVLNARIYGCKNTADGSAGGVYVGGGGALVMGYYGEIANCTATGANSAGGLYLGNQAQLSAEYPGDPLTVTGCTATGENSAGGVYMYLADLSLQAGDSLNVSGCTATGTGSAGGIYMDAIINKAGSLNVTDCTATGTGSAGGIYVLRNVDNVTLNVSGCKASGSGGVGGIYVGSVYLISSSTTVTISRCGYEVTSNPTMPCAGGVLVDISAKFHMNERSKIEFCTVTYTGGILPQTGAGGVYNEGMFYMNGEIKGCQLQYVTSEALQYDRRFSGGVYNGHRAGSPTGGDAYLQASANFLMNSTAQVEKSGNVYQGKADTVKSLDLVNGSFDSYGRPATGNTFIYLGGGDSGTGISSVDGFYNYGALKLEKNAASKVRFYNATNYGEISGGTFGQDGSSSPYTLTNYGTIKNGTFYCNVENTVLFQVNDAYTGIIDGGTFYGDVTSDSNVEPYETSINGGTFYGSVTCVKDSRVTNGDFSQAKALSGVYTVDFVVDGESVAKVWRRNATIEHAPNVTLGDGYVLDGWYKEDGYKYVFGSTYEAITADTNLTAKRRETTPPTGKITLDAAHEWTALPGSESVDCYFNAAQTATITGEDSSGTVTIGYLLSSAKLEESALSGQTFTAYPENGVSIETEGKWYLYAKLTDKNENTAYIGTAAIVIDTTAPTITGIENNKRYCSAQTVTVKDDHLDTVVDNLDEPIALDENGQITLTASEIIIARDKAGNETIMNAIIGSGHWYEKQADGSWKCRYCAATQTASVYSNLVINGKNTVCRTQDYTFTCAVPTEGVVRCGGGYELGERGDGIDGTLTENGAYEFVIPAVLYRDKLSEPVLKVYVDVQLENGDYYRVTKAVTIQNEHSWERAVCSICGLERLHKVSFDVMGGTPEIAAKSVKWSDKVLADVTAPSKTGGWRFAGWKCGDTAVGDNTSYGDLAKDYSVASLALVAQWTDIESPRISALTDGETYCAAVSFTVSDNGALASVQIGDTIYTENLDRSFTLSPAEQAQTVTVKDETGNETSVTVTVNDGHSYVWKEDGSEYWRKCRHCEDTSAKKPIPTITVSGAGVVVRGQDYTFTFTLPAGADRTSYSYAIGDMGVAGVEPALSDGVYSGRIEAAKYTAGAAEVSIVVSALTADDFPFFVEKTVRILDSQADGVDVKIGAVATGGTVVKVCYDGQTLTENEDYTLSAPTTDENGLVSVTLTGKGDYSGVAVNARQTHKPGDVNGKDGTNIMDVLALLKYVAGITDQLQGNGDVNDSGKIDIMDVLTLLKYVAGIANTVVY